MNVCHSMYDPGTLLDQLEFHYQFFHSDSGLPAINVDGIVEVFTQRGCNCEQVAMAQVIVSVNGSPFCDMGYACTVIPNVGLLSCAALC